MTTPILGLDEWEASQAQPNVTINTDLRWLECFIARSALDDALTAPPGSPADGDTYIVADGATGDWAGHDAKIALYMSTAWVFKFAPVGHVWYVVDSGLEVRFVGGSPPGWEAYP
jgi:hypothetical protein